MNEKKILVVDDSQVILKTLSIKLTAHGYKVFTAEDGSEAVSMVRRERPDLILLDVGFPPDVCHGGGVSWDGFLIMDWVRRMDEAKGIPVFIITADDASKSKAKALAAGATHFFHKPIDNEELLAAIHEALAVQPATAPASSAV